jgi:RNA polymerase sigma-70 factor (ECF subfamily)
LEIPATDPRFRPSASLIPKTRSESPVKSDEQLIAAYRDSGHKHLLDELVDRYVGKVWGMIYPMVLDRTLADDLTQEVFLRAFRGLGGFNGRSRFSTWLYRVAMNTAHSFLARRRHEPVSFWGELPDYPRSRSDAPAAAVMQEELESAVAAALGELPPKLRAAIVLTSVEQLDVAEAARIEGCTRATMYWRIHEARKRLKRRLETHLPENAIR